LILPLQQAEQGMMSSIGFIRFQTGIMQMKKLIIASAIVALSASASYAQSGANPSAPQPGSTGAGVNQPGTTSTGTAVDRPDSTKMKKDNNTMMKKDDMKKDGMKK
jgi:hypothetical protein